MESRAIDAPQYAAHFPRQPHPMSTASTKNVQLPENFTIPTMPAVVQRISRLLENPDVGLREIAQVVSEDAPLAAKVLKIANSTYYGLRERCISTHQAAAVLGIRVLKNVVTQASVIQQYDHLKGSGLDLDELWRHSIVVGQASAFMMRRSKRKFDIGADEIYVCGLLHDLGQVVLLDNLKKRYIDLASKARDLNIPLFLVEQQELGFNHADVGARIATRWGLPPAVVQAIAYHHGPEVEVEKDPIVALTARTNTLVQRVSSGNPAAASGVFGGRMGMLLAVGPEDETALIDFVQQALKSVET